MRALREGQSSGVREQSFHPDGGDVATDKLSAPAHPLNTLVAQLNERWRVVDDPLQWILQKRKGTPSKKKSGWQGNAFCRTRKALLRNIRERCGEIHPKTLAEIEALPEWHVDWEKPQ